MSEKCPKLECRLNEQKLEMMGDTILAQGILLQQNEESRERLMGNWMDAKGRLEESSARCDLLAAALAVDLGEWVSEDNYVDCGDPHWYLDVGDGVSVRPFDWIADALPLAYAVAWWESAGCPEGANDY